ncbi:MAG: phosphatase PAP2 family protein [Rhizomicrobium sp.]
MRYAPAIVCFLLFLLLAAAMAAGATAGFDAAVRWAIHQFASPALTTLAQSFSLIGSNEYWVAIAATAIIAFWAAGWRKQALVLAGTMAGAALLENGLKFAFHRARPEVFFGVAPETYSFPSGHALFAACLYGALALIISKIVKGRIVCLLAWAAALLFMVCIGWSRIYLGVHYPTDVLASYLAGGAWLLALKASGAFLPLHETNSPSRR